MCVSREPSLPRHGQGTPVPTEPKTVGEFLRKRRLDLGKLQSQVADLLGVSKRTLSLWETDQVYPAWAYQPRLVEYLGHDPFTDPALGRPLGNESNGVAFLGLETPLSFGQQVKKHRLGQRKTGNQFAKELRVDAKTLSAWESGRREPIGQLRKRIEDLLRLARTVAPETATSHVHRPENRQSQ